jgi:hypothetical protein
VAEVDEDSSAAEPGEMRVPPPTIAVPPPEEAVAKQAAEESLAVKLGPNWRRRRFWTVTAVWAMIWLLSVALIHTESGPLVRLIPILPFYVITLLVALRRPKALRPQEKPKIADRLTWTNKLAISIGVFVAIYIPFTFVSNKIIPYAPMVEFFLFAAVIWFLYRTVGRSVGVAPSIDALPPSSHRLHKQVIVAFDDPHYQQTLFLNYEFVDRGRGGKTLAKRLENAMEAIGIAAERRKNIVDDLEHYHDGIHWGVGLTRGGRERNRRRRERRSQVLRSVYTKFNQVLERNA